MSSTLNRAEELAELLQSVEGLIIPFVKAADEDAAAKASGSVTTNLVDQHPPLELAPLLNLQLDTEGKGKQGLVEAVQKILQYSVNTWNQGFLDKLYASTTPVGVISELLLAVLNTNVHVYQVSPALTLIERHTTRALAGLVGFTGPQAGGISQPGGSAANSTAMVIARTSLFPHTKTDGLGGTRYVIFTSAHGHYSVEKAAQMFGFGSGAVRPVPVDASGRMKPAALQELITAARAAGETPFFINATAGTTVLGSFDPLDELADICEREKLWLHVDGSWGGCVVFNQELRQKKLKGIERADSVTISPHKMLGVPMTCSFLIGKDISKFWEAMTLPASYLFHANAGSTDATQLFDLADLTPQCGRRGDSLKLHLSWLYYGEAYYSAQIAHAFSTAEYLHKLLSEHPDVVPVLGSELPPCLQVCFWWARNKKLAATKEENSSITERMSAALIKKGWMVDYAEMSGDPRGRFFRLVVNISLLKTSVEGFVKALEGVATELGL